MNKVLAWSRLMRLSNLPTAWSNILMGLVVSLGGPSPHVTLTAILILFVVSSCLYIGGMILNDVYDVEVDRVERPERVLPSGQISVRQARWVGYSLLVVGVLLSGLATLATRKANFVYLATPTCPTAFVLVIAILAYNRGGKNKWYGPILMGSCRSLNVLLGTSLNNPAPIFFGFDIMHWYVALCVGCYVAGITWFSRQEHTLSSRGYLYGGAAAMLVATAALLYLPFSYAMLQSDLALNKWTSNSHRMVYCGMLGMLLLPSFRRVALAIFVPSPGNVQNAVIACLTTLIMIDASLCYLFAPEHPEFAIAAALLIVPVVFLGRFLRGT